MSSQIVRLAARLLVALFFVLPLIWVVSAALHPPGVPLPRSLSLLPTAPSLANFGRLSSYFPLGRLTFNSLWITLTAVGLTLLTASLVAFAIALLPKRYQQRWVILLLALLMLPEIALWPTRFLLYRLLGWLDTPLALLAPAWIGTSPFFILMYYRAFRRIPREIYETARLDGAGILQTWWRVALPIALPTSLAIGLLTFVLYWGDFLSPLLYLNSERYATLPIALQSLQQLSRSDWALLMAGVVVALAVPVALFLVFMPYFNRQSRSAFRRAQRT
ncbi:MAG: carbohydrate ABC transporter permease [Chloroflexi bacterium]|nr:carbohydrate ABC transporter permease [Chloroflexota bacterium]